RRIAGSGHGRDSRRRIWRDGDQARGRRHRRRRERAGRDDGPPPAPRRHAATGRCGRRARRRHLPRPPPLDPAARRRRDGDGVIALLTGRVEGIEADRCVIDVGGVGYLVQASTRTLSALPAPPALARVLVETQVREDAISLYGFADPAEREWFRLLVTVQGVGARVALNILSALSPAELIGAIAA